MVALFHKITSKNQQLFQKYSYGIGDVKDDEHKFEIVEARVGSYRFNKHNLTYTPAFRDIRTTVKLCKFPLVFL